jgi:hypothetical protein
MATQPWTVFVVHWNWKAALLSTSLRGMLFFGAMVFRGASDMRGAWIEIGLRIVLGGCWGSMMQAMRRARPAWLAGTLVAVVLPTSAHTLEYALLKVGGAPNIKSGMTVSVFFSAVSLVVNYAMMRRGMMLTGAGAASLGSDLRSFAVWVRNGFR